MDPTAETPSTGPKTTRRRRGRRRARRSDPLARALGETGAARRSAGIGLGSLLLGALSSAFLTAAAEAELIAEDGADLRRLPERAVRAETRRWAIRAQRSASTALALGILVGSYRLHAFASKLMTERDARESLDTLHQRNAERFYETSVAQGGAFLKVGQLLSARPDLLPRPWIEQLSKLQDGAGKVPFDDVRHVVEQELGGPLDRHFATFDPEPVASASIAQVHRATTRDGRRVAVKVQRPDVAELVAIDLALLRTALGSLSSLLPPGDHDTIAREVTTMVNGELDFVEEARAMTRAANVFENMAGVAVPRPLLDLSTPRVLTTPFVHGKKITRVLDELSNDDTPEAPALQSDILGRLLEVYLVQVLRVGAFQADPHPGNFLVEADGTLVLLDFGCTKELAPKVRDGFGALMRAVIGGRSAEMGPLFADLGFETRSGSTRTLDELATVLLAQFKAALTDPTSFKWPTRREIFEHSRRMVDAMNEDPVTRIPADFVMIGRVFGLLGGLFQHYEPDIDWARRVAPHVFSSFSA